MTKAIDITNYLDEFFPRDTAESYDNPGYITGSANTKVKRVVLALDATSDAVKFAADAKAQMLIVHHPLIFGGINSVCEDDYKGRIITSMIRNNITSFAAHTNLDKNDMFSNSILAQVLGGTESSVDAPENVCCGVYCELKVKTTVKEFAKEITQRLDSTGVITYAPHSRKVKKLFVQGGAFDEESNPTVLELGADTVVSGEIKHHVMLELEEYGISAFVAGHNATERVFMEHLRGVLEEAFPEVEFVYFVGNEQSF